MQTNKVIYRIERADPGTANWQPFTDQTFEDSQLASKEAAGCQFLETQNGAAPGFYRVVGEEVTIVRTFLPIGAQPSAKLVKEAEKSVKATFAAVVAASRPAPPVVKPMLAKPAPVTKSAPAQKVDVKPAPAAKPAPAPKADVKPAAPAKPASKPAAKEEDKPTKADAADERSTAIMKTARVFGDKVFSTADLHSQLGKDHPEIKVDILSLACSLRELAKVGALERAEGRSMWRVHDLHKCAEETLNGVHAGMEAKANGSQD